MTVTVNRHFLLLVFHFRAIQRKPPHFREGMVNATMRQCKPHWDKKSYMRVIINVSCPPFTNLQLDKSILKTTSRFNFQQKQIHRNHCQLPRHKERKRWMLSETDLNKSSSLLHDYKNEFTVRISPIRVRSNSQKTLSGSHSSFDHAWIMVRSINAIVKTTCRMAQSIVPHDKPYKRLPDHPILPNKEIWNIAPHCETTNQQARLSEGHISVVLRHSSREKNGKKTSHIPSLITAPPNQVFNNQPSASKILRLTLLGPMLTTKIMARCLRREKQF